MFLVHDVTQICRVTTLNELSFKFNLAAHYCYRWWSKRGNCTSACHCTPHCAVPHHGSNNRNHALHASGSYQWHNTFQRASAKTQNSTEMHHTRVQEQATHLASSASLSSRRLLLASLTELSADVLVVREDESVLRFDFGLSPLHQQTSSSC